MSINRVEKQTVVALVSGSASTAYEIHYATQPQTSERPGYGVLKHTKLAAIIISKPEAGRSFQENPLGLPDVPIISVYNAGKHPEKYAHELKNALRQFNPDVIGQYGHTPKTPASVIDYFSDKLMINQHPGPINPDKNDFGGVGMSCATRVHAARIMFVEETGRNPWTEVVAQRVGIEMDNGKVLKRGRVSILHRDTIEELQKRAIKMEWWVQIGTLRDSEEGMLRELEPDPRLVLEGERITLDLAKQLSIATFTPEGELRPDLEKAVRRLTMVNIDNPSGRKHVNRLLGHIGHQLPNG